MGAGWGPLRNGFNLNYSGRNPDRVYVCYSWTSLRVCMRACMAEMVVGGGRKKNAGPEQSNVNYSGLGHLLCNSKMSQRSMLCLVFVRVQCRKNTKTT